MKTIRTHILNARTGGAIALAAVIASCGGSAYAGNLDIVDGNVKVTFDESRKTARFEHKGKLVLSGAYTTAILADDTPVDSRNYPSVSMNKAAVNDGYGNGIVYTYTYTGATPQIEQKIYVYPDLDYFLVEATLSGDNAAAHQICPIVSQTSTTLPLPTSSNRIYDMPFANDNWATFNSHNWSLGQPITSCEATALYNVNTRQGIIIGSVDHSVWKSAVSVTPTSSNKTRKVSAIAGYISSRTWDVIKDKASSTRHGIVKGDKVSSPRFMVGYFDDWRNGLETYGEANTVVCPKLEWTKDNALFGWQSWGGMEFGLNYTSAMSVLDFYEKELLPVGFYNEKGRTLMVLDSGWNALNDQQLVNYVNKCKSLNMVPGIYTTPFSYWGSEQDAVNNNTWEGGKLGEMALKVNGRYRMINALSLDPTHPKVREWVEKTLNKFNNLGFEFVKIDFMNNGSQEADSFYDPNITTGMQAYNYGMDYIVEAAGDMMIDFSIAPVFPAKAHVRRIGCDAWGDLPQSMYTLNCINGSWWLDRCYAFNDPDHMCLSKVPFNGKGSNDINEARIRYSCGLMTGMTLLGGTYAYEGDVKNFNGTDYKVVGNDAERARVVEFAKNKDLIKLGNVGKTFRPVEGTFHEKGSLWSKDDISVDNEFVLDAGDAFYYVVFNYGTSGNSAIEKTPDFARLGVNASDFVNVTELWTGETASPASLKVNVPKKDVRIYRFEKSGFGSGVTESVADDAGKVNVSKTGNCVSVNAVSAIDRIDVYSIDGTQLNSTDIEGACGSFNIILDTIYNILIVRVKTVDGNVYVTKVA